MFCYISCSEQLEEQAFAYTQMQSSPTGWHVYIVVMGEYKIWTICTVVHIYFSVSVRACVCVRVKGQCVGGHQLCEWCCFEAGWDRISRKGQREKSPLTKSKHFPHNSMSSPAGPLYRPTHAHTLTFPLPHTYTSACLPDSLEAV